MPERLSCDMQALGLRQLPVAACSKAGLRPKTCWVRARSLAAPHRSQQQRRSGFQATTMAAAPPGPPPKEPQRLEPLVQGAQALGSARLTPGCDRDRLQGDRHSAHTAAHSPPPPLPPPARVQRRSRMAMTRPAHCSCCCRARCWGRTTTIRCSRPSRLASPACRRRLLRHAAATLREPISSSCEPDFSSPGAAPQEHSGGGVRLWAAIPHIDWAYMQSLGMGVRPAPLVSNEHGPEAIVYCRLLPFSPSLLAFSPG